MCSRKICSLRLHKQKMIGKRRGFFLPRLNIPFVSVSYDENDPCNHISTLTQLSNGRLTQFWEVIMATFHLTISMRGQRATGKIQSNNYHHGSCGPSLTGKTMSVF